ncbi:hypothetical protein HCH_01697 [Hahella chejuensis KCTC 2396]|uniref:Uncharacterized protein n=1 Tax=Hahella chejuensis (strain KCTC 2396) TaxID=349521 RepID=Q2SLC9_HAHCH|nr:hypothetical protein HCH_01697 [Hahella chejuensis KCTC 2396]
MLWTKARKAGRKSVFIHKVADALSFLRGKVLVRQDGVEPTLQG